MKRTLAVLLAVLTAGLVSNHTVRAAEQHTIPIVMGYDVDGLAAADNVIFADTNIADSASYTITAQPDACRALVATITDADSSITAANATITGTDANGYPQTTTFALNGGSGTRSISGVWCSVVSVTNGVLTGETAGTDKIRLGTTGAAGFQYPIASGPTGPTLGVTQALLGGNPIDAFQPYVAAGAWFKNANVRVKTTGSSTSVTSFTASSGSLTAVSVGDEIQVNDVSGHVVLAAVIAKADNDNVTLDRAVMLTGATGHSYAYRKLIKRSGIYAGWFDVSGSWGTTVFINVKQMTGTGGIDVVVECTAGIPDVQAHPALASVNVASAGTKILQIADGPWDECRVGMKWATGDDADATAGAEERVDVWAILRK